MLVEERLRRLVSAGRMPGALLIAGSAESDALPMALKLARSLMCEKGNGDICEECSACHMTRTWAHPDLLFSLPIYKKNSGDHPTTEAWMDDWRAMMLHTTHPKLEDWTAQIKAENQQLTIYVSESDRLTQKLQMYAAMGGRRVIVIWLPERMMEQAANKLLKLIEEPPVKTHFILVSEEPDKVLGTILSRCQRIDIPEKRTDGDRDSEKDIFELFVQLMRLAYKRDIRALREWSEDISRVGRERQLQILSYFQYLLRENFIYNMKHPEMISLTEEERAFSANFSRFINENNVIAIMEETGNAQRDIQQNTNARMVFFDYALKIIILLIQK